MEWLDVHHPEYVDRLAKLSAEGRVEIIGGTFGESILTMIPPRDRVGQITYFTQWLQRRLGAEIKGMWIPERVWEQSLTSEISAAGIRYFLLDDSHFKHAGLSETQLCGYYVTENNGQIAMAFPGSERLRYLIPFAEPQESIDYLHYLGQTVKDPIVVFGDDGEKFGTWPDTKAHVYEHGWLHRFFTALVENSHWLVTTTLSDAHQSVLPLGKLFVPEGSYREMTEWVLPAEQQVALDRVKHSLQEDNRWHELQPFVNGGFWRNFKVRYPETDEMYARMMGLSQRLQAMEEDGYADDELEPAKLELYRGQCNCAYWHGAFGGTYLPHLRNAVYRNLINSEKLLDQVVGTAASRVEATAADFNFDGHNEVRLENDKLVCLLAPQQGGRLYELDVRSISHNLLATLARREEAYHQKVRQGAQQRDGEVASIHDRVVFKQEGLEQRLQYDQGTRKCLVDRFFPLETGLQQVVSGEAGELGNFSRRPYEAVIRRKPNRTQVMLSSTGEIEGWSIKITKLVTLDAAQPTIEIAYMLEGLPQDRLMHFGVEFNFAGLPPGQNDRFFFRQDGQRLGELGQRLDLTDVRMIGLTDEWLGIHCELHIDGPTQIWAHPVETVSQSEGGFELVQQSVAVYPHWLIQADQDGRWIRTMNLKLITTKVTDPAPKQATASVY
jgi:alpha-amylase